MNLENFVISGELIALCVAFIALAFMSWKLWFRADTASEERHKDYIDISNMAMAKGYDIFSDFMKCAAVDDLSGMYKAVLTGKPIMLNEALCVKHFEKSFKIALQEEAYAPLIIARAAELTKLDA